jgi:type IV pilus assembly protein PilQ
MKKDAILILIIGMLVMPFSVHGLTIKSVDFMNVDNKSRLQIGLDGQATYDVNREGSNVMLRIGKAKIPGSLARPFITEDFETAIKQILPKQDKEDVVFNITMKQMTPYFVSQDNKLLIMDFDIPADVKKKIQPAETVSMNATPKTRPAPANAEAQIPSAQIVAMEPVRPQGTIINVDQGPKYKGEHITLDFQNADIHNVLRIIADVSGLNIVTSDEVKGTITIRLKDIPWDQALDVVLESKDLDKMAMGNVVRIAPADTIKKAQERQLATKKTQEQLEPLVTSVIPVNFAKASEITTVIKGKEVGLLSERGNITAEPRTNVLIVKDTKKSVDDINAMVRRLDKPSRQVLISARIVQADTSFTKGLGIAWGGSFISQSSRNNFGLTGIQTGSNTGLGALRNPFSTTTASGSLPSFGTTVVPAPAFAVNFPQNQAAGFGITIGKLGGTAFDLDLRLDIGETLGEANVLARPKVVTLDNKKATIKQGQKYPYIQRDQNGQLSTNLIDIDLELEVTPRVAFDGSVNMEISVKRNAIGSVKNQLGDPSIDDREALTEVLVKNGETSVIGGIIEETTNKNTQKVPFLGDLPVIGYLFKGTTITKSKNELLIFITPQILESIAMQ